MYHAELVSTASSLTPFLVKRACLYSVETKHLFTRTAFHLDIAQCKSVCFLCQYCRDRCPPQQVLAYLIPVESGHWRDLFHYLRLQAFDLEAAGFLSQQAKPHIMRVGIHHFVTFINCYV